MQAQQPYFKITYNGKNITENISPYLMELSYTDKITGESDELEIKLEDKDGRWQNEWYPDKGATLIIEFGYQGGQILRPNAFELDEISSSFGIDGDIVTIKAVGAAFIKSKVKTRTSYAHENKTLSEIVNTIANKYGLTVIGSIANITIGRVTQKREKDMTFLSRLASEYGYNFNVRDKKLIFTSIKSLEGIAMVFSLDKTDIVSGNITDKSTLIFSGATVKSHNPNTNRVIKSDVKVDQLQNKDGYEYSYIKDGPTHEIRNKTENQQQGIVKAEAALHKFNGLQQTANFSIPGNILALAGNNIEITGIGKNSGIWNILSSRHTISISGFATEVELKKIIPATISGSKKKPKVSPVVEKNYAVTTKSNKDGYSYPQIILN